MKKYILKRIVYMVVVFFLVSILMYFLYNLIPSDPARNQLESVKNTLRPEEYEQRYNELREQMGLNDPILVRYARWMGLAPEKQTGEFSGMLQGDFGYSSFFKQDVSQVIPVRMKNTVLINIFVTILSLGITIPLGIYCAVHKRGLVDKAVQVFTIVGYSIPIYIVALLFIWLFAVVLRWFPVSGMETPGSNFTGLRAFLDTCYYLTLPVLVPGRHDALRALGHDRRPEHGLHPHRARKGPAGKGRHLFPRLAQRAAAGHHGHHLLVPEHLFRLGHRGDDIYAQRHGAALLPGPAQQRL